VVAVHVLKFEGAARVVVPAARRAFRLLTARDKERSALMALVFGLAANAPLFGCEPSRACRSPPATAWARLTIKNGETQQIELGGTNTKAALCSVRRTGIHEFSDSGFCPW
jgi:hypothetical protein